MTLPLPGAGVAPAIRVRHLWHRYGTLDVLRDVSFEVGPGEIFGFIGPNGAGKTTTIRIMATLLEPMAGRVEVSGLDVAVDPDGVASSLQPRGVCRRARIAQRGLVGHTVDHERTGASPAGDDLKSDPPVLLSEAVPCAPAELPQEVVRFAELERPVGLEVEAGGQAVDGARKTVAVRPWEDPVVVGRVHHVHHVQLPLPLDTLQQHHPVPRPGQRRQEQRRQDRNDGDHHEELDQCEAGRWARAGPGR